ncbi:MAG: hypothetical protein IJ190_01715 [Prevotella sp.]|nr:hypothetical protein [Prevotella sp.]
MDRLNGIFEAINAEGFSESTLLLIDKYVNDIKNGTEDFPRFNLPEHAGFSKGGAPLIGASVIACYATASLTASRHAEGCEGSPANWEIDELQERLIEQWARVAIDTAICELSAIGNKGGN